MKDFNKHHHEHRLIIEAIVHENRSVEFALRNGSDFCGKTEVLNRFIRLDAPMLEGRIVDCRIEWRSSERFFTACLFLGPDELKGFVGEEVLEAYRGKREMSVTIVTKLTNEIQEIDAETHGMVAVKAFGKASDLSPLGKKRLIFRVRSTPKTNVFALNQRFAEDYAGEMRILDEGIHEDNPMLGGYCTYWRIEDRGSELLYCSRYTATTDEFKHVRDVEFRNILQPEGDILGVTIESKVSRDSDGFSTMPNFGLPNAGPSSGR